MTELIVELPASASRLRRTRDGSVFVTLAVAFGLLGAWGSRAADLSEIHGWGLAAVLPAAYWVSLVALNITFAIALGRRAPGWSLAVLTIALIVVVVGAAALATDVPRGEVSFRHAGIVDALAAGGRPDGTFDAYFNWPGYFSWLALLIRSAGLDGVLGLALWAPVVTVIVWAGLVRNVLVALNVPRTWAWAAVWLFVVGNWIDQDYLSPQAFGYGVYLALILLAVGPLSSGPSLPVIECLRESGVAGLVHWWHARQPMEADSRRRVGALTISLVLVAGLIPAHQLTPFVVVVALGGLAIVGRSWAPWLPVIVVILLAVWFLTGAESFLDGHPLVQGTVGLENAASANLVDRLTGTPEREFVVRIRILVTATMWCLAAVGALIASRRRWPLTVPLLLAGVPFLLVPMQTYGGEMLLRAALFALPFVALLMAALFAPSNDNQRMRASRVIGFALVATVLCFGSVIARYGNAAFDMFTRDEVNGVQAAYALAPDGALMVSAAHPTPWRSKEYLEHKATTLQDICKTALDASECYAILRGRAWETGPAGVVLVVTRANKNSIELQGLLPPTMVGGVVERVLQDPAGAEIYTNADVSVYLLSPAGEGSTK